MRLRYRGSKSLQTVAVVVPRYMKRLTADEEVSYRHLMRFLGRYDKYFVIPKSLSLNDPNFGVVRFGDEFFRSTITYSALLLSKEFYRAFSHYKFILVYQLDALVFSDQLLDWCEKNWDYIGAPWIKCEAAPFVEEPRVGNGGFSLRKVDSFMHVLSSWRFGPELSRYRYAPSGLGLEPGQRARPPARYRFARRFGLSSPLLKGVLRLPEELDVSSGFNEDMFWSFQAVNYYRGFRIAPAEEGLRFAFEVEPRRCYAANNHRLPFGCHAWGKYDRDFWEPFLLR